MASEKVIEEMVCTITYDKVALWEVKLKLHMKPKPKWMPKRVWAKLVSLVLFQTTEIT